MHLYPVHVTPVSWDGVVCDFGYMYILTLSLDHHFWGVEGVRNEIIIYYTLRIELVVYVGPQI